MWGSIRFGQNKRSPRELNNNDETPKCFLDRARDMDKEIEKLQKQNKKMREAIEKHIQLNMQGPQCAWLCSLQQCLKEIDAGEKE